MSPDEHVRNALQELMAAADAANEAAGFLFDEVLRHRKMLISEATIARETATLLQHVTQTVARTTLAALETAETHPETQGNP